LGLRTTTMRDGQVSYECLELRSGCIIEHLIVFIRCWPILGAIRVSSCHPSLSIDQTFPQELPKGLPRHQIVMYWCPETADLTPPHSRLGHSAGVSTMAAHPTWLPRCGMGSLLLH
jgi:hypothetical protein